MLNPNELIEKAGRLASQRTVGKALFGTLDDGTQFYIHREAAQTLEKYRQVNLGDQVTVWGYPGGVNNTYLKVEEIEFVPAV